MCAKGGGGREGERERGPASVGEDTLLRPLLLLNGVQHKAVGEKKKKTHNNNNKKKVEVPRFQPGGKPLFGAAHGSSPTAPGG